MQDSVNAQVVAYLRALSGPPSIAPSLVPPGPGVGSVFQPVQPRRISSMEAFTAPVAGLNGFAIDSNA